VVEYKAKEDNVMQLSERQRETLNKGGAVRIVVDETECVLVRRDVYERAVDAGEWTDEEMALLGAEAAADLDDMEEIRP
jgi:hypothetical protein